MWETVLGIPLRRVNIFDSDGDKAAYVEHALGLTLIQTTDKVKPYSGGGNVNSEEDLAIIRKTRARHPHEDVALISSRRALQQYESESSGLDELVDIQGHYGNLKGSNEYLDTPVGIISGSTHFGDDFVKRWAAYLGESVEPNRDYESQTGLGMDLSYGPVGDRILRHMREDEVLQAILRFGRGTVPATVYVHTAAVPSWLPFTGTAQVTKVSNGERMILDSISELLREEETFAMRDLVRYPDIEIKERQISRHLNKFVERGLIEFETERGRRIYRPLVSFVEIGSAPIRVELSPQRELADTSS
jgi:DNA-binding transcriptional ArsR family regulator